MAVGEGLPAPLYGENQDMEGGALIALDLFCGGGGAARGILAAGFDEVVGIDIKDHRKSYPGHFIRGDVLDPPVRLEDFDLIWASPPCQAFSPSTRGNGAAAVAKHSNLIPQTRELLASHPVTVIENVPQAPIRNDLVLTGPMVGLNRIYRRRHFELSFWPGLVPEPLSLPRGTFESGDGVCITTSMCSTNHYYPRKRHGKPGRVPNWEAKEVMGITGRMTNHEVGESIPPAYAEFIAREALRQMQ